MWFISAVMWMDFLKILIGFVMLIGGAEVLVRGAAAIALRLGISALVVGLTIVAFGTSSPELVVSTMAAVKGQSDIALGTVVGSNICNILLILGVAGLIWPLSVHKQVLKFDVPFMCVVSLALAGMLLTGSISRVLGALLVLGVIGYTIFTIKTNHTVGEGSDDEVDVDIPEVPTNTWLLVLFIVLGPILLSLGSKVLLDGAVNLATGFGVSQGVIGLTLVAVGGSLPELATAVAAAYRKEGDIVVGNIVGSNIFNLLGVIGVAATIAPIGVVQSVLSLHIFVMVAFTLVLFAMTYDYDGKAQLSRVEGVALFSAYAAYSAYVIF